MPQSDTCLVNILRGRSLQGADQRREGQPGLRLLAEIDDAAPTTGRSVASTPVTGRPGQTKQTAPVPLP
jgi:hypothetical protein